MEMDGDGWNMNQLDSGTYIYIYTYTITIIKSHILVESKRVIKYKLILMITSSLCLFCKQLN